MKKMGYLENIYQEIQKNHVFLVSNHRPKGNKIPSKIGPSQYNKTPPDRYFEQ